MKRFELLREVDISGISGVGFVAEGVEFSNGQCVMCWRGEDSSLQIYRNVQTLLNIHGHGGKTRVMWIDGPEAEISEKTLQEMVDIGL